jgi:hypothetical protein
LQLIDPFARERCFTVVYKNSTVVSYVSEDKFLAYYEFDMWIAKHNGACVYECYGEKLGLPWGDIVESLVQVEESDIPKRKHLLCCMFLY